MNPDFGSMLLPALRPELQLLKGAPHAHGEPTWLIHDPLSNRFIQIDAATFEALRHWTQSSSAADLIERTCTSRSVGLDETSLSHLISFLHANQLTTEPRSDGWRHFARAHIAQQHSLAGLLIHHYLFFRMPLWQPQPFLERTLTFVSVLWSRPAALTIVAMGIAGAYLVSRRWDEFAGTFQSFFTWEGALLTALVLGLLKAAHELGHAYTAVRFGCRVHTMGVAFVVMAPMLYTDVTDAWRLTDRHKRFCIDVAGIAVETAIAAIALFAWPFLPDGPLRSSAFLLCAVSVVSSLAINLNPFMRFDGYYLLSEATGIENLQSRAFAVGRWKLRETLFGLGAPCPEELPRHLIAFLIVYAWAIWIYRVTLFVGIAVLVYHYFFKLLGIVLFAVEIIFFVARPIVSELRVWLKMRKSILQRRRFVWTAGVTSLTLAACLVPWSTRVEIPAVVESAKLQYIFPPRAALIQQIHVQHGGIVRAGDPIITLFSPDIAEELKLARISLQVTQTQYERRMADAVDREGSLVLESTISSIQSKIGGLEKEQTDLKIAAPFDGVIADINPDMHAGRWLAPKEQVAIITQGSSIVAKGYVAESDLWRISDGVTGKFIPENPMRTSFRVKVDAIASAGATIIDIPELASTNSGRISVNTDDRRRPVPTSAQYRVQMTALDRVIENDISVRGVVLADGHAESLIARIWRQVLTVLMRESGA